jgi:TRAP-type C4-dicarboxylate transport system permease small subunit
MADELNQPLGGIERLISWASNGLSKVSMLLLFVMMLFVAADVIGRLFFNMPFKGSTDLIELMMGIVVFFGMAYCAREDSHVRVDVVYERLPVRARACLDIITFTASLFIYVLIAWRLFATAWGYFVEPAMSRSTDVLKISHTGFIFIASLGSAILCLELAVRIVRVFSKIRQEAVV